jgi:hypothetical protein
MDCKLIWYNLKNKVVEDVVTPLKSLMNEQEFEKFSDIQYFDMPNSTQELFDFLRQKQQILLNIQTPYIDMEWFDLPNKIETLCQMRNALSPFASAPLIKRLDIGTSVCAESGDEFTIEGENFLGVTDVLVDGESVQSFTIVDDNHIEVVNHNLITGITSLTREVVVVKDTQLSPPINFSVFTEWEMPHEITVNLDEYLPGSTLTICQNNVSNTISIGTAQTSFKSSDENIFTIEDFYIIPQSAGEAYLIVDVIDGDGLNNGFCGRKYIKVVVQPEINITSQPKNTSKVEGSTAHFGVGVENYSSIQWKVSTDGGFNFTNVTNGAQYSGATSRNLFINNVTSALDGNIYYAEIASLGECQDRDTQTALLEVNDVVDIINPIEDVFGEIGDVVNISVNAIGANLTYQWFYSDGIEADLQVVNNTTFSGAQTAILSINHNEDIFGWSYYVVVTSGSDTAKSNEITIQ